MRLYYSLLAGVKAMRVNDSVAEDQAICRDDLLRCGHCDGKGIFGRRHGEWSCDSRTSKAGSLLNWVPILNKERAAECSI